MTIFILLGSCIPASEDNACPPVNAMRAVSAGAGVADYP
jgi:hypothetical protein